MGRHVVRPFDRVAVRPIVRNQGAKGRFQILGHIRIRILVQGEGGGGVHQEQVHQPDVETGQFWQSGNHVSGDDVATARVGGQLDFTLKPCHDVRFLLGERGPAYRTTDAGARIRYNSVMAWLTALLRTLPFTHSAMLLWALAAAVPIVIHFWSRRRYRQVNWAAMEFLLAAIRKNARRIRIEQLLLLALRVAILVVLALALANPVWSLLPALTGGGSTHHILIVDGSLSMETRLGDQTRFEVARQLAAQVVRDSRQGDGFSLILMADPPRVVIGEPAFAPADVIEEVENLRVHHTGANLARTLDEIEAIVQQTAGRYERLRAGKVYFFTDLGRTTWEEAGSEAAGRQLANLAERTSLLLVDVGQTDVPNRAVTGLTLREPIVTVGQRVVFDAQIENFSDREQPDQQVRLMVDDQQVLAETVTLPAGGQAAVSFVHRFERSGEHRVEVRLEEDALAVDDHRWASVPVREAIRVLCIEGRAGEAQHIALALAPHPRGQRRVEPEVRLENAILEADLHAYDAVFLCNVTRFAEDEAAVLYDYVSQGGGLVTVLGDQVQAGNYNAMLGAAERRVLPARLGDLAEATQHALDPLDYEHPIVAPFEGRERAGLLTTPVWRYRRATPDDQGAARVALAFQNGDPAIVEAPVGAGRSLLITTAASPLSLDRSTTPPTPWTALPTWPSFPPLVQETLTRVVRATNEVRQVDVGEAFQGAIRGTYADLSVVVERPDGGRERAPVHVEGRDTRWVYPEVQLSGIYTVHYGEPLNRQELFAANPDPGESSLQRLEPEMLPPVFHTGLQPDRTAQTLPVTQPAQYYRHLLALLLVLLLMESTTAWYFGTAFA